MELLQQLISRLGINEEQARGGAGLLFNRAKGRLRSGEFQQIAEAVPGMTGLLNAAPGAGGGMMGASASMASTFGGGVGEKWEGWETWLIRPADFLN